MKKIFTFLFATAMISSAFAQNRPFNQKLNGNGNTNSRNTYSAAGNYKEVNGNNGSNGQGKFSQQGRNMQTVAYNRDYDNRKMFQTDQLARNDDQRFQNTPWSDNSSRFEGRMVNYEYQKHGKKYDEHARYDNRDRYDNHNRYDNRGW